VLCTTNPLKGASGQAVQNMNVMLGLDQTTGLWKCREGAGRPSSAAVLEDPARRKAWWRPS
jgi:hypothetical protein